MAANLTQTTPALPVRDAAAVAFDPVSRAGVEDTDFGTREFSALDQDGNLLGFFRWVSS